MFSKLNEYQCPKCKLTVSISDRLKNRFCPNCGTFLQRKFVETRIKGFHTKARARTTNIKTRLDQMRPDLPISTHKLVDLPILKSSEDFREYGLVNTYLLNNPAADDGKIARETGLSLNKIIALRALITHDFTSKTN